MGGAVGKEITMSLTLRLAAMTAITVMTLAMTAGSVSSALKGVAVLTEHRDATTNGPVDSGPR